MGRFEEALHQDITGIESLPLLHTCEAQAFRSILETKMLMTQPCDVFPGKNLLYTYYGIPSYRSNYDKATSNPAYFMCCIVLNPLPFAGIDLVNPFDSGAFQKLSEMREVFFHHKATVKDFELAPNINSAKRVIKTYYGSSQNYLDQKPVEKNNFGLLDFEARGYHDLIANKGSSIIDDRASTIEVIFNKPIELNRNSVAQIIMPTCFKDDAEIMSLIKQNFNIDEPIGYETFRGNPKEYFGQIRSEYFKFQKT